MMAEVELLSPLRRAAQLNPILFDDDFREQAINEGGTADVGKAVGGALEGL